ncbi:MAG: hypothetical protein PVJ42_08455 [bacterium]|jgi:hypothetical protein
MRLKVPLAIIFVMGIFTIVTHFIPAQPVAELNQTFRNWYIGIISFFIFLGTVNLARSNSEKIKTRARDWRYSIILLIALAVMLVAGFYRGRSSMDEGSPFMYLYFNVQYPLEATMYSLLAFFITSAAFRAFRARNKEAVLLLVAAVLVMLGRVPIGSAIWDGFPDVTEWIMSFPNAAAKRGIRLGIDLGLISMALRMILGIERSYMQ